MKTISEQENKQKIINESLAYEEIIQKLNEAKENNTPIEEGLLGAIGGVILGTTIGPKLGAAICKALGCDPKGAFGSLLSSKLVLGSICGIMGWKS